MKKEYNIGIDIGTSSVGWAVTELDNQKIIRKGNKALWGVRLFEPASTAEDRRKQRSTRRRYDRRRERIKLLQEEFKDEINKIDSKFFQKLEESKYQEGDSFNKKIILQDIEKENIRNYYKKYKTIYHLRCELMNNPEKKDIRLVYLAIHHIIKYRGNFLNNNSNFDTNKLDIQEKLKDLFESIINYLPELDFPEEYEQIIDLNNIEKILLENTIKDTKEKLKNELVDITNSSFATELGKILVGNKCNLKKLLILDDDVNADIDFKSSDYDDKYNEYEEILDDKIEVLDILKQLYDMIFLKKLFKNQSNASISEKMAGEDGYYVNHEKDLKNLKELFKDNRKLYNEIFRNNKKEKDNKKSKCLYEQYIHNAISYNDFKNKIISLKEKLFEDRSLELYDVKVKIYIEKISDRLENGNFLPRITSTDNGRFPYQLNKAELIKIIENQGKYYPFLLNKLEDGTYKLVRLLEFKIPYYVGPLVSNKKSQFAWMIRKQDGAKITPYTFDEVVDKKKTAEIFIKRMISHCTYLNDKVDENGNVVEINYALANNSILYQRFKVMNELKQIKINDKKIENDIQHKIIDDFFKKTSGQLTETKFKNYLHASSDFIMYNGVFNITGYSSENKLANNMQSYIDFFGENGIFENTEYTEDDAEEIIEWITIFEDKDILKEKVKEKYELSDEKINLILNKNYSGWGTLSKRLLTTKYYKDKETEQYKSIMDLMYETKENFMQILNNDEYGFQKMIQDYNNRKDIKALDYSIVENLATSPATKRGIYQSLKVVDEIVKYMSYEPKNIIIEFARSDDKDKKEKIQERII